jgi:hypothetical protein
MFGALPRVFFRFVVVRAVRPVFNDTLREAMLLKNALTGRTTPSSFQ